MDIKLARKIMGLDNDYRRIINEMTSIDGAFGNIANWEKVKRDARLLTMGYDEREKECENSTRK